ncbi:hypothetical protein ACFQ7F_06285 [Streptomyces sp. NPDC056486]|uniref:hypothetical protein n=1 Tax=Streptomyces sp. NPDC056486 TaxID=3345835 RepID=UPI00367499CB
MRILPTGLRWPCVKFRGTGGRPATRRSTGDGADVPAPHVIDRDGTIRWAFAISDCTTRAEPADILAALDNLA